jgi:hypothetical protein
MGELMKVAAVILGLFVGVFAFAGPEERLAAQSCYGLEDGQLAVPASVPQEICLEDLNINLENESIIVYSYFQPYLFKNLVVKTLTRKNEDAYSFKASSTVVSHVETTCGAGEFVDLEISGLVDLLGTAEVQYLSIEVKREVTNDSCHSHPQVETFKYRLK